MNKILKLNRVISYKIYYWLFRILRLSYEHHLISIGLLYLLLSGMYAPVKT